MSGYVFNSEKELCNAISDEIRSKSVIKLINSITNIRKSFRALNPGSEKNFERVFSDAIASGIVNNLKAKASKHRSYIKTENEKDEILNLDVNEKTTEKEEIPSEKYSYNYFNFDEDGRLAEAGFKKIQVVDDPGKVVIVKTNEEKRREKLKLRRENGFKKPYIKRPSLDYEKKYGKKVDVKPLINAHKKQKNRKKDKIQSLLSLDKQNRSVKKNAKSRRK